MRGRSRPSAAIAEAKGIAAGSGNDTVENHGTITATSEPFVFSGELDLGIIGLLRATAATRSDARSVGIDGETGDDTLLNTASITATADSDAVAGGDPDGTDGTGTGMLWDDLVRSFGRAK